MFAALCQMRCSVRGATRFTFKDVYNVGGSCGRRSVSVVFVHADDTGVCGAAV